MTRDDPAVVRPFTGAAGNWAYQLAGQTYEISRERLRRDGGNGLWYCVIVDPDQGRVIDRRVPDGFFRTRKAALAELLAHTGCGGNE